MKGIILISGHAQNGKDTCANFMREYLEARGCKVQIMHYADELKFICKQYFGWDGNKDDAGRHILQYIGTDVVRKQDPDFWVDRLTSLIAMFWNEWDYVIVPDTRFPNEVWRPRSLTDNCWHVRVERTNFESPLTAEQRQHPSETALDYPGYHIPDFKIENAGTLKDLRESTIEFLRRITKE